MCGFLALSAGYAWLLLDWNNQVATPFAQETATWCGFGCSASVTQGIGLFLGLGVGLVGVVLCLADSGATT
jgi:hypothetical protein